MIDLLAGLAAAALALQSASASPPETAWTWTLYADEAPVVLANEVPDTPRLRTVLECEPGASVAQMTLYGGQTPAGMAQVSAGEASGVAELAAGRPGALRLALRTDHPVFAAFAAEGRLTVSAGDQQRRIEVPAEHLAKLRRFAELCSG